VGVSRETTSLMDAKNHECEKNAKEKLLNSSVDYDMLIKYTLL
jgi:hypothetical protein